jgi:hypothetical protein
VARPFPLILDRSAPLPRSVPLCLKGFPSQDYRIHQSPLRLRQMLPGTQRGSTLPQHGPAVGGQAKAPSGLVANSSARYWHLPLGLREEHFERWLFLWQANCRAQLPSDVAREMGDLAHHIAHKLRRILCISNEWAITARIGPEPLPSSLQFNGPRVERIEDNN